MAQAFRPQQKTHAEYLAALLEEMAKLASDVDLGMLAYLIAMAREEARSIALQPRPSPCPLKGF